MEKLKEYNKKRNFDKTKEPKGTKVKKGDSKKLSFFVQHHLATKDHYDFRLEWDGVLVSWAVPKGPSYHVRDKRLAIKVEEHPLDYGFFEGTIPKGEYGGGTVMLWDFGTYEPSKTDVEKSLKDGILKFELFGKRLKGKWSLIKINNDEKAKDHWLMVKEKDEFEDHLDIESFKESVKSNLTMEEIEQHKTKVPKENTKKLLSQIEKQKSNKDQILVGDIKISNPQKALFEGVKKIDIVKYYISVSNKMMPYLKNRIVSIVRCPKGEKDACFFKKHPTNIEKGIACITIKNAKNEEEEFFYIENVFGLIFESQMGTIEFHTWASNKENLERPDYMVFDLDPDENLGLSQVRQGVKDLKSILDKLGVKSFLKTSGGKGYHVVVPFLPSADWEKFYSFAKNIAKLMEQTWPDKYTSNMRKVNRKNKIFIDAERNSRGATSVVPYSLRARKKVSVSMPISWKDLDKIAPNDITMEKALELIGKPDPWKNFFRVTQELNS